MTVTQPGTHKAKTTAASVYETKDGALMVAMAFDADDGSSIIERFCLASKAGDIQQITHRNLREAYGWDGADPFWLTDTDLSTVDVEIVVENEPDQRTGEMRPRVRWVNKPGFGKMPESGDRRAILAKYGSRLRALAGGTPVKPVAKTAPPPAATKSQAPPPSPATKPANTVKPGTMEEAWGEFCRAAGDLTSEQQSAEWWYNLIDKVTGGKTAETCTAEDWGAIRDHADAFLRSVAV